tara:strand:- start:2934 stop:3461 length:528 start_codon:yes stop_codon:yes gene_type:complete
MKEDKKTNEIVCGCGHVLSKEHYEWHIRQFGEIHGCGCRECDYCGKLCGDGESEDVSEQPTPQAYKCRECLTPQIPEVWIMSNREVVTLQLVAHNLQVNFDPRHTTDCEIKLICEVGLAHHIGGGIPEVLTGILKGMFGNGVLDAVEAELHFRYGMDLVTTNDYTHFPPTHDRSY